MTSKKFPNDIKVSVLRANGTTYKKLQSESLIMVHGWTEEEVIISQANRVFDHS